MTAAPLTFSVSLKMLSDWAVSSGGGRQGSIDSVVERDADGLPYVPATTLRGIWRDAAEQVAFALDSGDDGTRRNDWMTLVDHLFGSQPSTDDRGKLGKPPIPSRLAIADLRLPADLRAALRDGPPADDAKKRPQPDRRALRDALCIIKPGVAIDARSGRAKADCLRFEEVARQGAMLNAGGTLLLSGDQDADKALVTLALISASLVERIGGNRRRGSGRCAMTVTLQHCPPPFPSDKNAAIKLLEAIETPKIPAPLAYSNHSPIYAEATDDEFVVISLDVAIVTPTVVAKAVLGNVVECLDHIPGTLLLSGVARLLQGAIEPAAIAPALANGDIRVLPAYPVVAGRRGLPAPLIMERLKDDVGGPDGEGRLRIRPLQRDDEDNSQYKSCRGKFIAFETGPKPQIAFDTIKTVVRTHNTVQDDVQKPTEEVGGVFTYEAIAAGARLKSEIWLRKRLIDDLPLQKLKGQSTTVSIGRAKKAGYGTVTLTAEVGPALPPTTVNGNSNKFALYLASDLLLPVLPGKDTSPGAVLRDAIYGATGGAVTIDGGEIRTARTDGWIARWGLPRPSYITIRAGSTTYVSGTCSNDQRAKLQREGLGLRRSEGFGQILIDPDFVTSSLADAVKFDHTSITKAANADPGKIGIPAPLHEFARLVEDAALKDAIRFHAERAIASESQRKKHLGWSIKREDADNTGKPNMSQLGAFRSVLGGLLDENDLKRASSFITAIEKTDRKAKWGDDAIKKLDTLLHDPGQIWGLLELGGDGAFAGVTLVSSENDIKSNATLQRFAISNLLYAAMRAHKRTLERAPQTEEA